MKRWRPGDDSTAAETRVLAREAPVALIVNGAVHAVMLASPGDLEDFALGFALTEGLIDAPGELLGLRVEAAPPAFLCHLSIPEERARRLAGRERRTAGYAGCGVCGVRDVDAIITPPAVIDAGRRFDPDALHRAALDLPDHQALNRESHAVHAAALVDAAGMILAVREDVGRHNALDKLIGHLSRRGAEPAAGAILMTSRCSVELVNKAATIGCPVLATVSLPTDLAVASARKAGISLACLVRNDGLLIVEDRHRRFS